MKFMNFAPSQSVTRTVSNYEIAISLAGTELTLKAWKHSEKSFVSQVQLVRTSQQSQNQFPEQSLTNFVNAKNEINNKSIKYYLERYQYETLPEECKMAFDNIQQLYEAFKKQEILSIQKKEEHLEVKLKFGILKNERIFPRIVRFLLKNYLIIQNNSQTSKAEEQESSSKSIQILPSDSLEQENKKLKLTITQINKKWENYLGNSAGLMGMASGMPVLIQNFINKMQAKWGIVMQEIEKMKTKTQKLQKQMQTFKKQMSANGKQKSTKLLKFGYNFSRSNKNYAIQLFKDGRIAKCNAITDKNYKIILLNPSTFATSKDEKNCAHQFIVDIKINQVSSYIALGICQKRFAQKGGNFVSSDTDAQGLYILDWSGHIWSTYIQPDPLRQTRYQQRKNPLLYEIGDIIKLKFKTFDRVLQISKLQQTVKKQILIKQTLALKDLSFCAILKGEGDEIEIMGTKTIIPNQKDKIKKELIEEEDEQK